LVVEYFLQGIDYIGFCINWKELSLKLLFEVSPGLDREFASICFVSKDVLGPLGYLTSFEEHESPKYFFLFTTKLLWNQMYVKSTGVEKGLTSTLVSVKVWRR